MPRRKVTSEIIELIGYMGKQGESVAEIADKLNLSYKTVLKHLKKHERTKKVTDRMREMGWRD